MFYKPSYSMERNPTNAGMTTDMTALDMHTHNQETVMAN